MFDVPEVLDIQQVLPFADVRIVPPAPAVAKETLPEQGANPVVVSY